MTITAEAVKQLRERTGAGMMECKKALVETNGDLDAAAENMRKSGLAKADKKASRVAAEGVIATATSADGAANLGAIIAVILGMLGGTFFPIGQGNDFLARLSYLTPHAWFMRGLANISGGAEWTEVLPAVGALLLFTLVFGTVAWVLLQRRLTR